jgi:hypothetical protein
MAAATRPASAHPQLAQRLFRTADHHRRVRGLMRIYPDHHCCRDRPPLRGTWLDRSWHAYFQDLTALAPLLSHATARSRQAGTSFESQTVTEPGPPGALNATTRHPNPARSQRLPPVSGRRISRGTSQLCRHHLCRELGVREADWGVAAGVRCQRAHGRRPAVGQAATSARCGYPQALMNERCV